MNQLLMLALLGGMACAQAAPSSFSADGSPPPEAIKSNAPATTTNSPSGANRLPDLLPQPEGKPTLIGGLITRVDRVRDELTVRVFGGGNTRVLFDTRTRIYRDGVAGSVGDLRNGERAYVDTMLAGKDIFAKNVRVMSQGSGGQSVGQVVRFDTGRGELLLNDAISPENVRIRILPTTAISPKDQVASAEQLRPGTLVSVEFMPDAGGRPIARQVSILAAPGNAFVFVGRVLHLDLHLGLLVVEDPRDHKTYEIAFNSGAIGTDDKLREGATVEVTTAFDGARYTASAIKVDSSPRE